MKTKFGFGVLFALLSINTVLAQTAPSLISPPLNMVPAIAGGKLPANYAAPTPVKSPLPVQVMENKTPVSAPVLQINQPVKQVNQPVPNIPVQAQNPTVLPPQVVPPVPMQASNPVVAPQTTPVTPITPITPITPVTPVIIVPVIPVAAPPLTPQALTTGPNSSSVPVDTRNNDAFMAALNGLMPLTPEQISKTKNEADKRGIEAARPSVAPQTRIRNIVMTLKPGETLPIIKTFPGNGTAITFADRTGAPWPVLSQTIGNKDAYNVQQIGDKGTSNIIVISPLQQFAFANNLIVTLVGNPVPLIFMLETGGDRMDSRVDVTLRTRGPNAVVEPVGISTLAPTNDSVMQGFVDGLPPEGARKVYTCRSDVEAWRLNDMLYVRTSLDLQSPAPISFGSNVSGTKVYGIMYSPVLLLSQNGSIVKAYANEGNGKGGCK